MIKRHLVCDFCGDRYQKLGYWDGCVGDCEICKGLSRLYLMTREVNDAI